MAVNTVPEMRGRSRVFVLLNTLFLIAICFAAYFVGRMGSQALERKPEPVAPPPVAVAAGLFIDPAETKLGEMWEAPEYTATVTLRNTSDTAIAVSKFGTSCVCSGIEPASVVVPAHGSVPLRVKMDLTHRMPHLAEQERRPFSVTLHPLVLQAGVASNGWEFTGVVRSRVGLSHSRLEFGDRCTHAGTPVTRKVRANVFQTGVTLEAVAKPRLATVEVVPVAGKPGEYEIAITPDPKLAVGPFRFDVPITAVMPGGKRQRCTAIEVSGEMQHSTRIVPSIVLLGEHPVGDEATAEVTVRLPARPGWSVDRVEGSPGMRVSVGGTPEEGALSYLLVQKITEPGEHVEIAKFQIANPAGAWETVEVTVRYYGVAAKSR